MNGKNTTAVPAIVTAYGVEIPVYGDCKNIEENLLHRFHSAEEADWYRRNFYEVPDKIWKMSVHIPSGWGDEGRRSTTILSNGHWDSWDGGKTVKSPYGITVPYTGVVLD